jgi:hypothetical protein
VARAAPFENKNGASALGPTLVLLLALVPIPGISATSTAENAAVLQVGGATLAVSFDTDPPPDFRRLALDWIARAASAVATYYGRFPVRHVDIAVRVASGSRVGPGHASGEDGPHIQVTLGSAVTSGDLGRGGNSWLMTHEMVHLALAGLKENHHWLEEGLATYVEPVARARAGELSPERVWRDMAEGMPQGEPEPGDRGLDHTPTWGRTYWGGALFCLLADVEIRKETRNTKGLEDALRGIVSAGGTINAEWDIDRVLSTGDRAIGAPILEQLYNQMKASAKPVDLEALWRELGVEEKGGSVEFREDAPMAEIRRAITARVDSPGRSR